MDEYDVKSVTNEVEIKSVSDYLTVLKDEVQAVNSLCQRFFRGLSKTKYIETDFPSIYRFPDNNSEYEPYIKYEHKMFYDLVSIFPEQFNACKNTFEHLVMMQHYGFPTRLLDITSNPLVALYFACLDGDGNINDDSDGVVTIYDINKSQIKNYNSDIVTILGNLARINKEYTPFFSTYNCVLKNFQEIKSDDIKPTIFQIIEQLDKNNLDILCDQLEIIFQNKYDEELEIADSEFSKLTPEYKVLHLNIFEMLKKNYKSTFETNKKNLNSLKGRINYYFEYVTTQFSKKNKKIKIIDSIIQSLENILLSIGIDKKIDSKFKELIQEEKKHFVYKNINPTDLVSIFCIKPKLNNPRIINQSGAFLLFGFAGWDKTKLDPPVSHFKYKAKRKKTNESINIIIPKENKQLIYDELKQLGIHRAFLFPEIDKVAQIVTNEYKKKKSS